MKKTAITVAILTVLAGGAVVGGGFYADQQLKKNYYAQNNPKSDKRFQVTLDQFNMGITNGKASWKASIVPDLCNTSLKINLRGEDSITRDLNGYRIQTKIYLVLPEKKEFNLFDGQNEFTWTGNIQSKMTIPAGEYKMPNEEGIIKWSAATVASSLKYNDGRYELISSDLDFPGLEASFKDGINENNGVLLKLGRIQGHTESSGNAIGNAGGKLSLDSLSVKFKDKQDTENFKDFDFSINKVNVASEQKNDGGKISATVKTNIDNVKLNEFAFDKIQYNFGVYDLNQAAMERFNKLALRQSQECLNLTAPENQKEVQETVFALLSAGIKADSKGNQVYLNNAAAKADADVSLPAGDYSNEQKVTEAIPAKLKYNVNVEIDKNFIREGFKIADSFSKQKTDKAEIEKSIQEMADNMGAELTEDKIIFKRSQ